MVSGVSERGRPYDAGDPELSAWVHNALTVSFLSANQAFGSHVLTDDEADRFVLEQTAIGRLLGSDPLPTTAGELNAWVNDHPDVAPSQAMRDVVDFLNDPPMSAGVKAGYKVILEAAVSTLPERLREVLDLSAKPGAEAVGSAAVKGLRWALGYSPSWALALTRMGIERPQGVFKQDPQQRAAS